MRIIVLKYLFSLTVLSIILSGCQQQTSDNNKSNELETDGGDAILYMNSSKYGVSHPETFVYMQNRCGIRAEYCIDRAALELWLSPLAGKSDDYKDRNWSNRDDHTMLFDRIHIPGLSLADFDSCSYDPFHLKLYFKNNVMHLSQVYDKPSILIWFEKPGQVDFKVNAKLIEKTDKNLIVEELDRGRNFEFSVFLGEGDGVLNHQRVYDQNRSIYARAELEANQYVMISGELATEKISRIAKQNAAKSIDEILAENEQQIALATAPGTLKFRDNAEMQKLIDVNKRVAISLQDFSGIMRTTTQYIYYLLWYRDAGVNSTYLSYSGMADVVKNNANVVLQNPNISYEEPEGKFFGQIMAGPLSKWEEDGLYFVVWPAFAHWTQTGDDRFTKGIYMENMEAGLKWLEDYCFDEEMGLFGRYFANETPFKGSHDFGYDYATGAPTGKWIIEHKGKPVVRTYDIYVNLYNYNIYLMLSAMTDGEKSEVYLQKAKALEKNMMAFYKSGKDMPYYGYVETEDGAKELVAWDAIDHTDFLWPVSIAMFHPNLPEIDYNIRWGMYNYLRKNPKGNFICAYNTVLASMDTKIFPEDSIMAALDYLVPQSIRPGKYRPMPYTMPEMVDETDGHPFHDVRPIGYTISPWIGAVANVGIKRLPFGLALRPNKTLESISNYQYQNGELHISYLGEGDYIEQIVINERTLKSSLQLPVNWVRNHASDIHVKLSNSKPANRLVSSTVSLQDIKDKETVEYSIYAFGHNVLTFENLKSDVEIINQENETVNHSSITLNEMVYISFEGKGQYKLKIK